VAAAIAYPTAGLRRDSFHKKGGAMSLGMPELLIILVIVILIFGASRLAGLGRGLGQAIRGFKEELPSTPDEDEREKEPPRPKAP
jgi:sec-independent protein translocase protein TatA